MIIVYPNTGGVAKYIRPCPFVSISYNPIKNKMGSMGGTYDITLTGTILADEGSPLVDVPNTTAVNGGQATFSSNYNRPAGQLIPIHERLGSILVKQNAIRELFSVDGQKVEILSPQINGVGGDEPIITFYPRVQSIDFEEGVYVQSCKYTISLQADFLLDNDSKILYDGLVGNTYENDTLLSGNTPTSHMAQGARKSISDHINEYGGIVEDFNENWSIEPEDGNGNTVDPSTGENIIRTYRLTRNASATGRTIFDENGQRYEAWQQAKSFIAKKLLRPDTTNLNGYNTYPKSTLDSLFASNFLNLATNVYGGYNHSRTESIDKNAGTYTVADTWLLSREAAYENYDMSLSNSIENGLYKVSINGSIKGLTSIPANGSIFGGNDTTPLNSPHENATIKYRQVSNNGNYGATSWIYKRCQNAVGITLNPTPLSVSIGSNEFTGEITYSVEFDTRPTNLIAGVLSEQISIQDTYPGDVFAIIPVIGRPTGPILQYIGGRTEYQRSIGIDIVVASGYGGTARQQTLLSKPILIEPMRSSINNLISQLSPAREPGIRKYFLSPPSESWDPKERRYTLNLSWTYEIDH
jgi:hypothetical protein